MKNGIIVLAIFMISCQGMQKTTSTEWNPYDESAELAENAKHESQRMRYKLIQSKILNKNEILQNAVRQLHHFTEKDYLALRPLILEQSIPTIQAHIQSGKLSYEKLTQWYLYRIVKFETDKNKSLNNIISINPDAVKEARKKDRSKPANNHPLFGMPVLIKDNIDMQGLATTAGAHAFLNNNPSNAFIVDRLLEKGAIILGKTNLSEWANYLCLECPNGYSAVGGQTLNPYGRRIFDTGGSSSGSGSSMGANYAAAAVGTETSGSILSPSSSNSIVGLKPTTGLLSRGGIVPISGTFDTPGPMTRTVIDNAIMLSAMTGEDEQDAATKNNPKGINYLEALQAATLKGLRFGVYKSFLSDSLYKLNVEKIKSAGGIIIEINPDQPSNDGFGTILNADMKMNLPAYIKNYASANINYRSVADIVDYNNNDSLIKIPYGQGRLEGVVKANTTPEALLQLKNTIHTNGINYFEKPMNNNQLDAILSIANRNAGLAAAANYPCITVPMGYRESGEPAGITFIGKSFTEDKLLKIAYAFEQVTQQRKLPGQYK